MTRPEPGEPSPWDTYAGGTPTSGVPVTPAIDDRPTQAIPTADPYAGQYERTVVQPAAEPLVPAARVYAPAPQVVVAAPIQPEPVYLAAPDNRPPWVAIAAVIALLVGGLVGFLIGHNTGRTTATVSTTNTLGTTTPAAPDAADQRVNDIFTLLAAQARQPTGIQTPTPYPALDDLLGTLDARNASSADTAATTAATAADGSGDTSALTAERDQLAAQVADLQDQLTESQAALATAQQTASTGGSSADDQAQLDDQAQQIATLQKDLETANTDLQSVQSQLDTANQSLDDLDPKPVDNQVGLDIARVRSTAKANSWTLVEQPIESATAAAGTVTSQSPQAGTNMIKGSVLYVEVAAAPGSTG